jgi:hypothetical protein
MPIQNDLKELSERTQTIREDVSKMISVEEKDLKNVSTRSLQKEMTHMHSSLNDAKEMQKKEIENPILSFLEKRFMEII